MHMCRKCEAKYDKEEKLNEHIEICVYEKLHVEMPKYFNRKYISNGAELYHPYDITLDFECTLKKINQKITDNTKYIHEHKANSFSFQTVDGNKLIRFEDEETLMQKFNNTLIDF